LRKCRDRAGHLQYETEDVEALHPPPEHGIGQREGESPDAKTHDGRLRQSHPRQRRGVEQSYYREHDRQSDDEGNVDECRDLGDVDGPQPQRSVEAIPDCRVHQAAEPEAVGEGVARKRGQGDPTKRQRFAYVAKCQRVIEHQQSIAGARQPYAATICCQLSAASALRTSSGS
jgi:hypothetical protein